jgi:hypothetical protein
MFYISLEAQNKELQLFIEPQKQRNKAKNARNERVIFLSQILFLDPIYFQQLHLVQFSFILNDFKGYKCDMSKSIILV